MDSILASSESPARTGSPFPFDNSYARLPERFYAQVHPTPVRSPRLIALNHDLADQLGADADWLAGDQGVAALAGNGLMPGADPVALAYAGHQFGHFVRQLGDGRAILLGEVIDKNGERRDIQLKGAGRTPFSRNGDGRAALGPVVREYIVSEAMHKLGIRTTRALAACLTGETVQRETGLPGAILTRVARSHIRVGTFEYFAARQDGEGLRLLAEHAIARHYPDAAAARHPFQALFNAVVSAQAALVASWMRVGFIHGVMNTDNCSIAGETIDYGPCAFLDTYHPDAVFSAIDRGGRYAFANQPVMAQWNMARLAEAMLPLLGDEVDEALEFARDAVASFTPRFAASYRSAMATKLGLSADDPDVDILIADALALMAEHGLDYTQFFTVLGGDASAQKMLVIGDKTVPGAWLERWQAARGRSALSPAEQQQAMAQANPVVIPRNHQIEAMIASGMAGDFAPFAALAEVLSSPYDPKLAASEFAKSPQPHERVEKTFCGT